METSELHSEVFFYTHQLTHIMICPHCKSELVDSVCETRRYTCGTVLDESSGAFFLSRECIMHKAESNYSGSVEALVEKFKFFDNFPTPGVRFIDISSILADPDTFNEVTFSMTDTVAELEASVIVAPEARAFPFAAVVASNLSIPLVMARKSGKLPGKTISCSYSCEYANRTIEIQQGSIPAESRVVILDDIIATGHTSKALEQLVCMDSPKSQIVGHVSLILLSKLLFAKLSAGIYPMVKM